MLHLSPSLLIFQNPGEAETVIIRNHNGKRICNMIAGSRCCFELTYAPKLCTEKK